MRYADVSEGDRTVRLYFLENAAQEARKHVYTTDEALLNKMEIRPYENVLNNAFATSGIRRIDISGAWRPLGALGANDTVHPQGLSLDIGAVNGIPISNESGKVSQSELVRQFSYNLMNGGASQVIQPWMTARVPLDNYRRDAYDYGFKENVGRTALERQHLNHLHVSYGR